MNIFRRYSSQYGKFSNVEESALWFKGQKGIELYLSIDGSSTRTGMAIIEGKSSSLIGTMAVERDRDKGEDYVEYKIRLKNLLKTFMDNNIDVLKHIYYEEPFVGFTVATEVLMTIRTTVKEIKIENAPKYDHIKFTEVNNQKWKKIFLRPLTVPSGTDNQKIAVQQKIMQMFGNMVLREEYNKKTNSLFNKLIFTEDECDAIGLGIACTIVRNSGHDDEELISKKKAKPFKYNIQYLVVAAEEIDEAEMYVLDNFGKYSSAWKIPEQVISNGIATVELNGRGAFDNHVLSNMGNEDKLLILEFPAGKYVDAVIRNGRSDLCKEYSKEEFMFAFVWRKSRK